MRFRGSSRTTGSEWLSLGEASKLLGVAPNTLRRWSDSSRVDTFTTPGGHRRYRRSSLERMLPAERIGSFQVRSSMTPVRLARAYRAEAQSAARQIPWLAAMDDDRRQWFRDQGRRLADELLAHLDAPDEAASRHHLQEATAIAAAYGRTTSAMGAGLGDALEAFLRFRRPFLDQLAGVLHRRGVDAVATASIGRAADQAMDALLVAAMAAHRVERVAANAFVPRPRRPRQVGLDPGAAEVVEE